MNSRKVNIVVAVLVSSVLLLTAGVGAVYAFLSAASESHTDTLAPAVTKNPDVSISETVTLPPGKATAAVTVPDAGYPVYVRAVVVVNWIKDGQICATPVDASYGVTAQNWTKNGDFYYYKTAVNQLNDEIEVTYTEKPGYGVQVQVICQTIQAVGTEDEGSDTAVFDAWGVTIDGSGS